MSYNKSISFPEAPSGFSVTFCGDPSLPADQAEAKAHSSYERGKAEAAEFYQTEIKKLRDDYARRQEELLAKLDQRTTELVSQLDNRLPDLVVGLAERVLDKVNLDGEAIEGIVKGMVSEFAGQEEKLEVYLCPQDLSLLRAMARAESKPEEEEGETESSEEGFASAIAGIFDGLDGDESLLAGYPNLQFFEDPSLVPGDCQIKSRFGLLDGRISTKLRKVEEELKGDD